MDRKKLMYSVLKEIEKGNYPNRQTYELSLDEFGDVIDLIINDELIKNASVIRGGQGNKVQFVLLNGSKITSKGLSFLDENSIMSKAYSVVKEIRDWIK